MFFDGHKCEDVIEYQEIFLNEIKSLLSYFVDFFKDGIIILKKYPNNCILESSDQRPIIMIIYSKSIFFTNNKYKKIWILDD